MDTDTVTSALLNPITTPRLSHKSTVSLGSGREKFNAILPLTPTWHCWLRVKPREMVTLSLAEMLMAGLVLRLKRMPASSVQVNLKP